MPRVNLTTKFLVLIGLVAALAVVNGLIAVYSSWRMGQLLQGTLDETLPSLLAAEELEISLMEQSGHVASYLLDGGNRQWLEDMAPQKQNFEHWLARAKHTSRTPEQNAILVRLESVFGEYYAKRSEVLALHDAGQRERSTALLLDEVNPLYRDAFKLCEQFIAANQHFLSQRAAKVQQQVGWMTW